MPVGFLTDEQRQWYGRFRGEPTAEDLSLYFHLEGSDRSLIAPRRGSQSAWLWGTACAVRYLGTFPEDLTETPATVVAALGSQLGIEQPECFADYCASRQRWDHTVEIRERGGYEDFSDGRSQFRFNRWLTLCVGQARIGPVNYSIEPARGSFS
ncbi:MAG: DUF4158 domain-containing protein [Acidobacteriaceae bacterium]|nr:DUF4158 domain-containing protein [Acidobacteriaceae bacterium]